MAAKITGIGGLALAAAAMVEAHATASTGPEPTGEIAHEAPMKVQSGNCGCAPCWGPPAPPARGAWS